MKKFLVLLLIAVFLSPVAYAQLATDPAIPETAVEEAAPAKQYFCPMDGFESDKPGKCEKCGMDLVEKVATTEEAASEVTETAEKAPKA